MKDTISVLILMGLCGFAGFAIGIAFSGEFIGQKETCVEIYHGQCAQRVTSVTTNMNSEGDLFCIIQDGDTIFNEVIRNGHWEELK